MSSGLVILSGRPAIVFGSPVVISGGALCSNVYWTCYCFRWTCRIVSDGRKVRVLGKTDIITTQSHLFHICYRFRFLHESSECISSCFVCSSIQFSQMFPICKKKNIYKPVGRRRGTFLANLPTTFPRGL